MTVKAELSDEQARRLIRAASVYSRQVAEAYLRERHRPSQAAHEALAESKAIDEAQRVLEAAVAAST